MRKKKRSIKIRRRWRINPKSRVKESARRYSRAKQKRNLKRKLKDET